MPVSIRGRRWAAAVLIGLGALGIGALLAVTRSGDAALLAVPANTAPPVISGTLQVGSELSTTNGTWTGAPPAITFTYQWQRCDENGASCSNISGATQNEYTLRQVDAGTTLRVVVRGTNADGNDTATSVPTGVIGSAQATGCPTGTGVIQIADLQPPARLLIDRQVTTPPTITRGTDQIVVQFRVSACGGRPVQGALGYVTAVPYNQFSIPPEAQTNAEGMVSLTMNQLRGFPAARQQILLVMFLRARKEGENILGGVSTRRLVSFPVRLTG
jgi:hypothetical protein